MQREQITRRKLSEQVVDRLEAMIREGTYEPGSHLPPERELMDLFGVGRPSVREALFALQRMGLVRIVSGERPLVTRPTPQHLLAELSGSARYLLETPEGVEHFEQARLFLETSLARHAAAQATDVQRTRLTQALERNRETIGHPRLFGRTDVAFHRVIAEIPGNPIFVAMHDATVEWLIAQRPALPDPEANNRDSFADHREIHDAILARDPVRAAAAMEWHLTQARVRYADVARKIDPQGRKS